ncbi:MAG: imidazole glycerol phosphate synthase subunit HisF [Saprospiraceae bacterium]|nr:imidazole glycerol phosphate synthase subunit HisF [Saprospiraceae bacterium]
MLAKRIIPCLDVKEGRTVKGINFVQLRDAGDPVALGKLYSDQGADELVFLDITATKEKRKTLATLADMVAQNLNIPFTIGGGISSIQDVDILLKNGADKVSINSSAVKNPDLINELSLTFGSQCIVAAIDARFDGSQWKVYVTGGSVPTGKELFSWARETEDRGAGEILFTSMNHDGTKNGFALAALAQMADEVSIPIIASGGAGNAKHFVDLFQKTNVDAGLAASIFHFQELEVPDLKRQLAAANIPIRLN